MIGKKLGEILTRIEQNLFTQKIRLSQSCRRFQFQGLGHLDHKLMASLAWLLSILNFVLP